jgi:3-deoxy-D-manno-octulosonic-acid transferase
MSASLGAGPRHIEHVHAWADTCTRKTSSVARKSRLREFTMSLGGIQFAHVSVASAAAAQHVTGSIILVD